MNKLKKNSDLFFLKAVFTKNYFLVNLKSEMEAGDLAVIGADDLDTQDYIFEKLRPHTIRKSTRHCWGGEFYFDPDGQYVCPKLDQIWISGFSGFQDPDEPENQKFLQI